jgi:RimJ/RimL family protein N-acetyltransferase
MEAPAEMTPTLSFRPLSRDDLPRLAEWLNRPHLRRFFQPEPITLEQVVAKYAPRIRGEVPTLCSLALLDGIPFGYLQCYRICDWPDWQAVVETPEGIAIDLFIADPDRVGRGLGRRMLTAYVETVAFAAYPDERLCWISHEQENGAARACSEASGFMAVRTFVEDGKPSILLVREG